MRFIVAACSLSILLLSGCTTIPPFTLGGDSSDIAPAGPKVAALIANLKCELWEAAHDETPLPVYMDVASLKQREFHDTAPDRTFTLRNIFQEIDFIAEAQFTLDVTTNSAANPALNFITPYTGPTNFTLSVGGQLSDAVHRNISIYSSVDGERLIESPINPLYFVVDPKRPRQRPIAVDPRDVPCGGGSELGGNLGLRETIATSLIAARMNDVAVFESGGSGNGVPISAQQIGNYAFGQIGTQVDFTIIEGVNGGPLWTLSRFKGPGGNPQGFLNFSRTVKDTLVITILPICIREKYFPTRWNPHTPGHVAPTDAKAVTYPMEYEPKMGVGTPGWANWLPPCNSAAGQTAKALAPEKARINNQSLEGLQLLQQLQ